MYLYTDNVPGNLHEAALNINRQGRAAQLVDLHPVSPNFCIAVYRVDVEMRQQWWTEDRRTGEPR